MIFDDFLKYFKKTGKSLPPEHVLKQLEEELSAIQINIWREEKDKARRKLLQTMAQNLINNKADLSSLAPVTSDILIKWNTNTSSVIADIKSNSEI